MKHFKDYPPQESHRNASFLAHWAFLILEKEQLLFSEEYTLSPQIKIQHISLLGRGTRRLLMLIANSENKAKQLHWKISVDRAQVIWLECLRCRGLLWNSAWLEFTVDAKVELEFRQSEAVFVNFPSFEGNRRHLHRSPLIPGPIFRNIFLPDLQV